MCNSGMQKWINKGSSEMGRKKEKGKEKQTWNKTPPLNIKLLVSVPDLFCLCFVCLSGIPV